MVIIYCYRFMGSNSSKQMVKLKNNHPDVAYALVPTDDKDVEQSSLRQRKKTTNTPDFIQMPNLSNETVKKVLKPLIIENLPPLPKPKPVLYIRGYKCNGEFEDTDNGICGTGFLTNDKGLVLEKGVFVNNMLVSGSKSKSVTKSNKTYVEIHDGTFVDGLLHGENCKIKCSDATTIKKIGKFEHGKLIEGSFQFQEKWYHGSFSNWYINGEGCISTDFEKKEILSKGTYVDDELIKGSKLQDGKWYHGTFVDGKLEGEGTITTGIDPLSSLWEKGLFVKGNIVKGIFYQSEFKQWVTGTFDENKKFHGEGTCYSDNKEVILSKGTWNHGVLIDGIQKKFGMWVTGKFNENNENNENIDIFYVSSTHYVISKDFLQKDIVFEGNIYFRSHQQRIIYIGMDKDFKIYWLSHNTKIIKMNYMFTVPKNEDEKELNVKIHNVAFFTKKEELDSVYVVSILANGIYYICVNKVFLFSVKDTLEIEDPISYTNLTLFILMFNQKSFEITSNELILTAKHIEYLLKGTYKFNLITEMIYYEKIIPDIPKFKKAIKEGRITIAEHIS